jgi:N-acetylglutamate synthase-like GNAT family acetyltransferase
MMLIFYRVFMIRKCSKQDFDTILEIINDAARTYQGVIPADRWHEPYMPQNQLQNEIASGVVFWAMEENGELTGVMGIQDKGDVTLIRHAYVRTGLRNRGAGSQLLHHLETMTDRPILIGTWAAATWAVAFYEKNGYRLVSIDEKNRLLKKYWNIPERQVETSVVLTNKKE